MQDSMMMADVGDIVKVRGSRIATPLAPPNPGRTPITTPRMIPTNIRPMFIGVRTTPNPCISAPTSCMCVSIAEEAQWIERALEQRDLEPHFEHEEEDGVDDQRGDDALQPGVLSQDDHEQRD